MKRSWDPTVPSGANPQFPAVLSPGPTTFLFASLRQYFMWPGLRLALRLSVNSWSSCLHRTPATLSAEICSWFYHVQWCHPSGNNILTHGTLGDIQESNDSSLQEASADLLAEHKHKCVCGPTVSFGAAGGHTSWMLTAHGVMSK